MDLTNYRIKDIYNGKVLRFSAPSELAEWLEESYATLTDGQQEMIRELTRSFEQGNEHGIKWYGAACGLDIEPKKKTRRNRT